MFISLIKWFHMLFNKRTSSLNLRAIKTHLGKKMNWTKLYCEQIHQNQIEEVQYVCRCIHLWISLIALTLLGDLLLGNGRCGPFTHSAPRLGHLVLLFHISALVGLWVCRSINRRPLDIYVSFTSRPHHFLTHANNSGSPASRVPPRWGQFRTRASRRTSKTWRFRHSYPVFSRALDLLNVCRPTTQSSYFRKNCPVSCVIQSNCIPKHLFVEYSKWCPASWRPNFPGFQVSRRETAAHLTVLRSHTLISLLTERVQTSTGRNRRQKE